MHKKLFQVKYSNNKLSPDEVLIDSKVMSHDKILAEYCYSLYIYICVCVCVYIYVEILGMANNKAKVLNVKSIVKIIIVSTLSPWWPYTVFQVGTACIHPLSDDYPHGRSRLCRAVPI